MFNENIEELHDIIPSIAIMRLYDMIKDIYKNGKKPYMLNEVDMQKLYINYGDKYTAIDKVILLIYGIISISEYRIEEEKIPIERVNISTLSEKERALYDKNELHELVTTKIIINSNVGVVVIGYDYAYVRKEIYTPNIEINDDDKVMLDDDRLVFNINYPYISIKPDEQIINISPLIDYDEFIMKTKPKHSLELYTIDVINYKFTHTYSTKPLEITDEYEVVELSPDKIPTIDGWAYKASYFRKGEKEQLVIEYTNDDNKVFYYICDNDYSISVLSYDAESSEYIKTRTYFINYGSA